MQLVIQYSTVYSMQFCMEMMQISIQNHVYIHSSTVFFFHHSYKSSRGESHFKPQYLQKYKLQNIYTDAYVQTNLRHSVHLLHVQSISDPQPERMESKFMNPLRPSTRLQEEVCDTGLFVCYLIILICIFCAAFVFSHSTKWDL